MACHRPNFLEGFFLQRQPNNQFLLSALFFLAQFSDCEPTFHLCWSYSNFILTDAADLRGSYTPTNNKLIFAHSLQCSRFAVQTTAPCWWELDDDETSVPLGGRQGWKQELQGCSDARTVLNTPWGSSTQRTPALGWVMLADWGQSSCATGCQVRLCHLHPQRFSRPNWFKPWATWSDPRADQLWAGGWTGASWGPLQPEWLCYATDLLPGQSDRWWTEFKDLTLKGLRESLLFTAHGMAPTKELQTSPQPPATLSRASCSP